MSGWSDYKATGDKTDLEVYRQECEAEEKDYYTKLCEEMYEEMEEAWQDQERKLYEDYISEKVLKEEL